MKKLMIAAMIMFVAVAGTIFSAAQEEATEAGPVTISMFVQMDNRFDPESVPMQRIMELAGVNVEYITPPRESYTERKNILLASGKYPDIIEGVSVSEW